MLGCDPILSLLALGCAGVKELCYLLHLCRVQNPHCTATAGQAGMQGFPFPCPLKGGEQRASLLRE